MKQWQIKIPIFDHTILLINPEGNLHRVELWLEDKYNCLISYSDESTQGRTYILPNHLIVIVVNDLNKNVILHECTHAVWELLELKGIKDQECFCYLIEFLYFKVLSLLEIND